MFFSARFFGVGGLQSKAKLLETGEEPLMGLLLQVHKAIVASFQALMQALNHVVAIILYRSQLINEVAHLVDQDVDAGGHFLLCPSGNKCCPKGSRIHIPPLQ